MKVQIAKRKKGGRSKDFNMRVRKILQNRGGLSGHSLKIYGQDTKTNEKVSIIIPMDLLDEIIEEKQTVFPHACCWDVNKRQREKMNDAYWLRRGEKDGQYRKVK